MYCLYQANHKKLNTNWAQYEAAIVPQGLPGGGGYSLLRFNLNCLFEQHELARNIWTRSNKYFPFVRYLGCTIKIYRPENTDVCVKFQNCYPMTASPLLYMGTQPSIMMMSKNSHKIPCKRNNPRGKPYRKFKFPPPQNMVNKWFFFADIAATGLLLIATTACSFEQYYISKNAESNNITLYSLNVKLFTNRNFKNITTTGYHPQENKWMWATNGTTPPTVGDLIYLGNSIEYQNGTTLKDFANNNNITQKTIKEIIEKYMQKRENWGNPFHSNNTQHKHRLWFKTVPPLQSFDSTTTTTVTLTTQIDKLSFTEIHQELFFPIRYNPQKDKGEDTMIYLLPNWKDEFGWDPPNNPKLIQSGFPAWLIIWGFLDYHKKLGEITQQGTHYIMVMKSKAMSPELPYYVFIDHNFWDGDSEYYEGRTAFDDLNWFPMTRYQDASQETLAQSGPGVAKLDKDKSSECHCEYKFYFKEGGCMPPMEKITNPAEQPTYPLPTNEHEPNSLQSPEEPIETFLYQFDERWGQITAKAADRITKDYGTKQSLFTDSTTTGADLPIHQTLQKEMLSSEEEEAQEETLFEQLQHQRNKQKQLRIRINNLLKKMQNLS